MGVRGSNYHVKEILMCCSSTGNRRSSRETVKTLISIMLAQAQEVFLEKQIADQKKVGLLAKLSSQAATLYGQAVEGVQENVN